MDAVTRAIGLFKFDLRGKSVLLKPNLVEYIAGVEVNTNPVLVGAAAEAFLRLGAKRAIVAEGPGHQRDTYLVLVESGLDAQPRSQAIDFVDLNRDELVQDARHGRASPGSTTLVAADGPGRQTSLCPCPRSKPTTGLG